MYNDMPWYVTLLILACVFLAFYIISCWADRRGRRSAYKSAKEMERDALYKYLESINKEIGK